MKADRVVLGIGGNENNTRELFSGFRNILTGFGLKELNFSGIYATAPFMGANQNPYLNFCCTYLWSGPSAKLLEFTQSLETALGRPPKREKWSDRGIDIDILLHGERKVNAPDLIIPHYQLAVRDFFLIPALQILPGLTIPGLAETPAELLRRIPAELRTAPAETEADWA